MYLKIAIFFFVCCLSSAMATHIEPLEGGAGQDGWKCYCGANNGPFGGPGEVWTCSLAPSTEAFATTACDACCAAAGYQISTGATWQPQRNLYAAFANTVIAVLNLIQWPGTPPPVKTYVWSGWYNSDGPGGVGDFEGLAACPDPIDVECRTNDTSNLDWRNSGLVYRCNTTTGGTCVNSQQVPGVPCRDFKVRFACPVAQPQP